MKYLFGFAFIVNVAAVVINVYSVTQGNWISAIWPPLNAYFAWGSLVRMREILAEEIIDNPDEN